MKRAVVEGIGSCLPDRVMENDELAREVDTSDEWIRERTGIHRRHLAAPGESTADLSVVASRRALAAAEIDVDEVDMIVLATTTPDDTFPATATVVQAALGMTRGAAFDIQAVCSGFVYGLAVADGFIRMGQARTVLVIGAEVFSRLLDWSDRTTCVLFGDGAGAVVLRAGEGRGDTADRGILHTQLHSDGRHREKLYVDGGTAAGKIGHVRMDGREVFRHAVVNIAGVIAETLSASGLQIDDIDWFVPHQANRRILENAAKRIGLPEEKLVVTIADHGNTSAASVPLALSVAASDGRIKKGDLVLMEAMGGGFTWGAALVRW